MNEDPDRPQPSTSLRNDEIVHLLDVPYGSDDECDEVIDEDNITDDQIFARLDEILDDRNDELQQQRSIGETSVILPQEEEASIEIVQTGTTVDISTSNKYKSPMRPSLSVDEQICATKTHHNMRQYNPRKPHKWGYKLYVLCDDKGFSHQFEIYSGQTQSRLASEPDLGETGNIVVRLCRKVPRNVNYTIYCDNFYSSLLLFSYLRTQGIFALGTFRRDRIPNIPFTDKKEGRKESRGTSVEFTTNVNDTKLSMVSWRDNDSVMLGSTLCGVVPMESIKRYDRKAKKYIDVPCPQIVKVYNKHMGGVDLMDSHIGRHHIRLRSRKWYFRMFYHMVDMAVVNAWILHSTLSETKGMTQKEFRTDLGVTLCKIGSVNTPKRGRPSNDSTIFV
ncbi:piggyBac transposable element-derived protein 2-like [Homalodisca vitripennis]|uniref:piggyBac transposable element-derived protein 2-like n=1 Tax=Homalodisca vitripennis TaxID=197043 RepID=UPI001EEC2F84|nr:piggyBac transposable element-derived protein 2-like [Homalodisca vitripennis]